MGVWGRMRLSGAGGGGGGRGEAGWGLWDGGARLGQLVRGQDGVEAHGLVGVVTRQDGGPGECRGGGGGGTEVGWGPGEG